jgi:hypothetical protein
MIFKKKIRITSSQDIINQKAIFNQELSVSQLSSETKKILKDQIELMLMHLKKQFDLESLKKITADRTFEGDGYHVQIFASSGEGFFKKMVGILKKTDE